MEEKKQKVIIISFIVALIIVGVILVVITIRKQDQVRNVEQEQQGVEQQEINKMEQKETGKSINVQVLARKDSELKILNLDMPRDMNGENQEEAEMWLKITPNTVVYKSPEKKEKTGLYDIRLYHLAIIEYNQESNEIEYIALIPGK